MSVSDQQLLALNLALGKFTPEQRTNWLLDGFARMRSRNPLEIAHAFPPLELRPDGDAISQLGAIFNRAKLENLNCVNVIESILRKLDHSAEMLIEESLADILDVWRLWAAKGGGVEICLDARRLLVQLQQTPLQAATRHIDELVATACLAVSASTPITDLQVDFFNRLKKEKVFWKSNYVIFAIDVYFRWVRERPKAWMSRMNMAEKIDRAWMLLRDHFVDDLVTHANPKDIQGQVLLASIARNLGKVFPQDATQGQQLAWTRRHLHLDMEPTRQPAGDEFVKMPQIENCRSYLAELGL